VNNREGIVGHPTPKVENNHPVESYSGGRGGGGRWWWWWEVVVVVVGGVVVWRGDSLALSYSHLSEGDSV
jgi:hypothetical protein